MKTNDTHGLHESPVGLRDAAEAALLSISSGNANGIIREQKFIAHISVFY